jgi:ankyrin repeat protein
MNCFRLFIAATFSIVTLHCMAMDDAKEIASDNWQMDSKEQALVSFNSQASNSSLLRAVHDKNIEKVRKALKEGADANMETQREMQILMYAVKQGDPAIVQALLNAGAQVNAPNFGTGQTALMEATLQRNVKHIELLVQAGANARQQNSRKKSALDYIWDDVDSFRAWEKEHQDAPQDFQETKTKVEKIKDILEKQSR